MTATITDAVTSLWAGLGTNLGSGVLFFVLDLMLIVLLLPAILNRADRRRWRHLARALFYEALTRIEIVSTEANGLEVALNPR